MLDNLRFDSVKLWRENLKKPNDIWIDVNVNNFFDKTIGKLKIIWFSRYRVN